MSRLIVKNLPKNTSEQKIRDVFGKKGTITDIQLKFKDGKFRQFGFVGFESEESAQEAVKFLDNTFFGTSKIRVEVCAALGDESKPKSWSRYAKDSESYKKKHEKTADPKPQEVEEEPVKEGKKKSKKQEKIDAILAQHKDDPLFEEFLKSHAKDKLVWENDIGTPAKDGDTKEKSDDEEEADEKIANKEISDADYMKQLMGGSATKSKPEKPSKYEKKDKKPKEDLAKLFTIKIRNIPKKVKREELIKFFRPAKAHSVRIPRTAGFAYVGFKLERDLQRALTKDKSFLKGKQIHVYDFTEKNFFTEEDRDAKKRQNPRWQEQQDTLKNEEEICDSGKLFFRNLAYTVTEDDLQKLFEKYGTVVEVNLPIDSATRKIKGFGTVIFMLPENAVTAYNELNGSMFHGRMFHLLPGKADDKKSDDNEEGGSDFKSNKLKELKKSAGASHNWNTLFMGSNAVAEAMATSYGKSKEDILESSKGGSNAAVRLALGETQIVLEMKKFLEGQGVQLDAFEDSNPMRSKTVILAKNLPAGTRVEELREKFAAFGVIDKIILPPSGVTCLIKFDNSSEARKAFKGLAYSKFKHLPLFLEWAPEKVFRDDVKEEKSTKKEEEDEEAEKVTNAVELKESDDEEEDDTPPEANTTLFLKGLNFQTTESTVKEKFKHLGPIHLVQIAKKRNPDNPQQPLALGYGFIQFKQTKSADKALKTMQFCSIDEKKIELKRSDRTLQDQAESQKKPGTKKSGQNNSTKIMIRNIPFQANANEIRDLFKTFGELRAVRLPMKQPLSLNQHRGFGFVDFVAKSDAKNAFEALHHSTHLYGRRLVLEWAANDEDVDEIRKRTADQVGGSGGSKPKKSRKALLKDQDFIKLAASDDEDE